MKIFQILIISLFSIVANAQDEFPIFTEDNNWIIKYAYWQGGPWEINFVGSHVSGDTIIDGQEYKIFHNPSTFESIGFVRELNKKAYFRSNEFFDTTEVLLYDFSLEIGDTFKLYTDYEVADSINNIVLQEIDSVQLFDGSYRKRFVFGELEYDYFQLPYSLCADVEISYYWIDGIGTSIHPIYSESECFEGGPNLDCYSFNQEEIYGECLYNPIEETYEGKISISPNPFSNQVNIFDPESIVYKSILINLNGTKIIESYANEIMNLDQLPHGVYILEVELKDKSKIIYKLIK